MRCTSPLSAWQTDSGEIVFAERGKIRRALQLRCGQCIECRLERSRQWAVRCVHEASLHDFNSFVTLTYSDDHVTTGLRYRDFQLFMKRLRKHFAGVRFYMCGEYGETYLRPHFHACLFRVFFADRELMSTLPSGFSIYRSALLEELWPFGFSSIGDVNFQTAAYVARYVCKKVTGAKAEEHYRRVDIRTGEIVDVSPEFTRMSLKPGIGADWYKRWRSDVYPHDYVVVNGVKMRPPKYYDKLLAASPDLESDHVEYARYVQSQMLAADSTPERLAVLHRLTKARLSFKRRNLEL